MRHSAVVAADCVVPTNNAGLVPVTLINQSACRQCARGVGCGAGLLTLGQRAVELQCLTDNSVRRGQRVTIETESPDSGWLLVVLIAFGLPVLGLFVGLAVGTVLGMQLGVSETADWPAASAGFIGLCGGVLAWQKVAPQLDRRAATGLCSVTARIVNIDSDS